MAYDSLETWRLYEAEASVKQQMRPDTTVARQIAREIMASSWWRMLPYRPAQVRIETAGRKENGMVVSHIVPQDREFLPESWLFSLHPARATERTVLHELAHVMTARLALDTNSDLSRVGFHGAAFAGPYVEMLQRFSRRDDPEPLFEAMHDYGVQVPAPGDWREQLVTSLGLEQAVLSGHRPVPVVVPPVLALLIRQGRASHGWSPEDLAQRVAASPESISRVEDSISRPQDAADAAVALRAAVLLGADPIVLSHTHGFSWDGQLEQLRELNPEWVELVEHMIDLKARRPSWWEKPLS